MNKSRFLTEIYNKRKMVTSFQMILGIPHTIFQREHLGTFLSVAMQNPIRLLFLALY